MDCHLQMMIWNWCLLKNPSLMIGTWFSNSAIWSVDLNVHGLLLQQSSVSFSSMIRRAFSDGFSTHRSWQHVQGLLLTHMGDSKRGSHSESYFKKAFQAAPEGWYVLILSLLFHHQNWPFLDRCLGVNLQICSEK